MFRIITYIQRVILSGLVLSTLIVLPGLHLYQTASSEISLNLSYSVASAETGTTFNSDTVTDQLSDAARSALLKVSGILSVFLTALNYMLWPVLMMIGALMDNSLIFGGGMEDRLLLVWSQIRNIVNLAFVVILVGIAIYNVLGIGEEGNYTIKKILPKFIIALIVVNFTFIGAKVALDAANVATTAMFALPNSIEDEFNLTRVNELERAVCGQLENMGASTSSSYGGGSNAMCTDGSHFSANARQFFQRLSSSNIALVMAVNMGQIHKGVDVSTLVRQSPTVPNLAINMIFSIVMYIAYATSFIALFLILLGRVVALWLVIALSPLFALKIVFPSAGDSLNELQEAFIGHLIAPIKIGFGMTVGYIMLDAYQSTSGNALGISLGEELAAPFSGINSLQQLIIAVSAVAIVWKVTASASEKTFAKNIVSTMQRSLQDTGLNIAKLPLSVPIVPFPDGNDGQVSLLGMGNRLKQPLREYIQQQESDGLSTGSGGTNLRDLARDGERNRLNEERTGQLLTNINEDSIRSSHLTAGDLVELMESSERRSDPGSNSTAFRDSLAALRDVDAGTRVTDLDTSLRTEIARAGSNYSAPVTPDPDEDDSSSGNRGNGDNGSDPGTTTRQSGTSDDDTNADALADAQILLSRHQQSVDELTVERDAAQAELDTGAGSQAALTEAQTALTEAEAERDAAQTTLDGLQSDN